jgi:hypothetical protein
MIDFYWTNAPLVARIIVAVSVACLGVGLLANLTIALLTIVKAVTQ